VGVSDFAEKKKTTTKERHYRKFRVWVFPNPTKHQVGDLMHVFTLYFDVN
jgi:hypothetical protein